jgi:hypothetical protein
VTRRRKLDDVDDLPEVLDPAAATRVVDIGPRLGGSPFGPLSGWAGGPAGPYPRHWVVERSDRERSPEAATQDTQLAIVRARAALGWSQTVTERLVGERFAAALVRAIAKAPPATADADQQRRVLERPRSLVKFNEQQTTSIEWARWSWNPVTGCRHNCSYCYARDIAERFYQQGFVPTFLPERLAAPRNTQVPASAEHDIGYRNVFTCSMADLFGRWVPREWIDAVLVEVAGNPQWNFLFLTKFPQRLPEFMFPSNAWVGTTVDAQAGSRLRKMQSTL